MNEAMFVIFLLPGFCVPSTSLSEYYFINSKRTWYEARTYCSSHYTAMAQLQNTEDVQTMMNSQTWHEYDKVWIGLYGGVSEWTWVDGTAAEFVFWNKGEPDNVNANESCVTMTSNGYWNNVNCSATRTYVCHFGGSEFSGSKQEMTWDESKTSCKQLGGVLAIIPNNLINSKVKNRLSEFREAWIGLSRRPTNFWYWSESGVNYMFTNWQKGQPDNLNVAGSCAAALADGSWTDEPCNATLPFFCTNTIADKTEEAVFDQKSRKTVVRMKIQSSANMENPAYSAKLLQQLRRALANQGVTNFILTWKNQPVKQDRKCYDNEDAC